MRALALLALCCAALALTSCNRSKPQPTLVGKWRTPSGGQFEFRADGTVIRTLPFATLEDKYQLLDEGTLEIQETQGGARKRIRFAFRTPDEVTFTYPDGPPVV